MDQFILHYDYFKDLIKCSAQRYKSLILQSSADQLRAVCNFLQLCAHKKIDTESKLVKVLKAKRTTPKKIIQLLLRNRAVVQAILCVAFKC